MRTRRKRQSEISQCQRKLEWVVLHSKAENFETVQILTVRQIWRVIVAPQDVKKAWLTTT